MVIQGIRSQRRGKKGRFIGKPNERRIKKDYQQTSQRKRSYGRVNKEAKGMERRKINKEAKGERKKDDQQESQEKEQMREERSTRKPKERRAGR